MQRNGVIGHQPTESLGDAAHIQNPLAPVQGFAACQCDNRTRRQTCQTWRRRMEAPPGKFRHSAPDTDRPALHHPDNQQSEDDTLEIARLAEQAGQYVLQYLAQQHHHRGPNQGPPHASDATQQAHKQVIDAGLHIEWTGAYEALGIGIQPARYASQSAGNQKHGHLGAEYIHAHRRRHFLPSAQGPNGAAGTGLQQVAQPQYRQQQNGPNQIDHARTIAEDPAGNTQRRQISNAGLPAQRIKRAEQ